MNRIFIVDDDKFFRKVMQKLLSGHGYDIAVASGGEEALEILKTESFDVMISDINMTPMDGLELLEKCQELYEKMGVIMLTGHDEIQVAIDAMKKGAFDFLVKPFQLDELLATVQRSLGSYRVSQDNTSLQSRLDTLDDLVAKSDAMRKVCTMIRRVAPSDVAVLLCGEDGSARQLIARTLHYYSPRQAAPFISADCAEISADEIETKLFQTTSRRDSPTEAGLFESAQEGTLFLDNIDAMPLATQAKLFEVMQTNLVRSDEALIPKEVDVRLIVASTADLAQLVENKSFYEVLYYRLSALRIDIPPLRSRGQDIPLLIEQAIYRRLRSDQALPVLDSEAKEVLYSYTWPGNLRELEETVEHMLSVAEDGKVTVETLPEKLVGNWKQGARISTEVEPGKKIKGLAFKAFLQSREDELLGKERPRKKTGQ